MMKPPLAGCSLDFMCKAQKLLAKHYGDKLLEAVGLNQVIAALGDAERAYAALPDVPKPLRKRRAKASRPVPPGTARQPLFP